MPPIFPTACECSTPGWCPRHKCFKARAYFELCRRSQIWFAGWERGERPGSDPASAAPARVARQPCIHLGAELRRQDCPTCPGHVELKIFACAVHRECALSSKVNDVACCQTCVDFEARDVEPSH